MTLALFDFDGTITNKDSMLGFVQFAIGKRNFFLGLLYLLPILALYKLKFITNNTAKEKFLAYYFKGYAEDEFKKIAKEYSLFHLDNIVKPSALEKINWHKHQGHKVVVVSASIECWLQPWCGKNKLELLATKLNFKNGKFTGYFESKNCYGLEKVVRIKEKYDLSAYSSIYAYGDSSGDKEMLEIADKSYYRCFTE